MQDTNYVIEGKHKGDDVYVSDDGYVYLGFTRESYNSTYLDRTQVKAVQKLNEESSSYKTTVAKYFGSVAAAGAPDVKDIIIEVEWISGGSSLIKVREVIYTKILATVKVDVAENRRLNKEWEKEQKNFKKYQKACQYQKNGSFELANDIFLELAKENYKDSSERIKQIQNEIEKICNDPDKPIKLKHLRKEYKKYAIVNLLLGIIVPIISVSCFVFDASTIGFLGLILALGYWIMCISFFKKVKNDKALEDVYVSRMAHKDGPGSDVIVWTFLIVIIAIILLLFKSCTGT